MVNDLSQYVPFKNLIQGLIDELPLYINKVSLVESGYIDLERRIEETGQMQRA